MPVYSPRFIACLVILFVGAMFYALPVVDASSIAPSSTLSITSPSINAGEVNIAYSQRLSATGGVGPYAWFTASPLPAGLTFSADGLISGTPQSTIEEQFIVSVTDASGSTTSVSLILDVVQGLTITTPTLANPVLGVDYSTQLSAAGGVTPYTWSVQSGSIPLGLVLNSNGLLSGLPAAVGMTETTIAVTDAIGVRVNALVAITTNPSPALAEAYFVVSKDGAVSIFASPGVSVAQTASDDPGDTVGVATEASGSHYWFVSSTGHVTASPRTRSFGSVGRKHLVGHIVGIAAKSNGSGYWLVSSTGRVYGFGSARSLGSVAPQRLVGHIVGIAAKSNGSGYWLVSSTGRVYGFGSAHVLRERGKTTISPTVVGIASDSRTGGYWIVTSAGRVYAFGKAGIEGSIPAARHLRSVSGIAASPGGGGYWLATRAGPVYGFGSAASLSGVEVAPGPGTEVAIASAS